MLSTRIYGFGKVYLSALFLLLAFLPIGSYALETTKLPKSTSSEINIRYDGLWTVMGGNFVNRAWVWSTNLENNQPNDYQKWKMIASDDGSVVIKPYSNDGLCLDYEWTTSADYNLTSADWIKIANCEQGREEQRWILQKSIVKPKGGHQYYVFRSYKKPGKCIYQWMKDSNWALVLNDCLYKNGDKIQYDRFRISGTADDKNVISKWADFNAVATYSERNGKINGVTTVTSMVANEPISEEPKDSGYAVPIMSVFDSGNPKVVGNNVWYTNNTSSDSTLRFAYNFSNTYTFSYGFSTSSSATVTFGSDKFIQAAFNSTFTADKNWTDSKTATQDSQIWATVKPNQSVWFAQSKKTQKARTKWNVQTAAGDTWTTEQFVAEQAVPSSTSSSGITSCTTDQNPVSDICRNSKPDGIEFSGQTPASYYKNPFVK
ncbi:hypothetical protein X941_4078 [Burkholderia pseudomallei MSHR5569]|nr:hypothetical protein X941_4078 [Burkholderia pseudomallei MSHR5569]